MNLVRLRNGKIRFALGLVFVVVFLFVTYVIHDNHSKLVSTRSLVQDCEHKRESLSAQLQVTFEHKSRLEKALQQEKSSHKRTKEKLESQYEELQEQTDKEKQEAQKRYSSLQQQKDALQNQQEMLYKEFSNLQQTNAELVEEKQNLMNKMTSQMDQLKIVKEKELLQLQNAYNELRQEKEELILRLDKTEIIRQLEMDLSKCRKDSSLNRDDVVQKNVKIRDEGSVGVIRPESKSNKLEIDSAIGMKVKETAKNAESMDAKHLNDIQNEKNVGPPPPNIQRSQSRVSSSSKLAQNLDANEGHQLALPVVVERNIVSKDENVKKVERSNVEDIPKKDQQLAEPPVVIEPVGQEIRHHEGNAPHDDVDQIGAGFRREAELVANGLEQQENGEDQDLDDMENEVGGGDKKDNHRFQDADFDQPDQEDNDENHLVNAAQLQIKPEGVIAVPH